MIELRLTRELETAVRPTPKVLECAAAFGIGIDESVKVSLYQDLPIRIDRGRVIYLTGESGAGKSTLLRHIAAECGGHPGVRVMTLGNAEPDEPLIEQFPDLSTSQTIDLFNMVGIAEPFIYLRSPGQLSDGQRYRYQLARLIQLARNAPPDGMHVICIDEFVAMIDRPTAKNVAYQVRRVATKTGICFVVATTHDDISYDLQANTTVTLRLNVKPECKVNPMAGR